MKLMELMSDVDGGMTLQTNNNNSFRRAKRPRC